MFLTMASMRLLLLFSPLPLPMTSQGSAFLGERVLFSLVQLIQVYKIQGAKYPKIGKFTGRKSSSVIVKNYFLFF